MGVFPMHCSATSDDDDPSNVALFFGLSGTGKTTLSADPNRPLIGDDEHGWSDAASSTSRAAATPSASSSRPRASRRSGTPSGSAPCSRTSSSTRSTRVPDYDDGSKTENTRVTYPVELHPGRRDSLGGRHPKNVLFLTADAFGVLPPGQQAHPRAGDVLLHQRVHLEARGHRGGRDRAAAQLQPLLRRPFLPRPPMVYAEWLARRVEEQDADVWLLNTGWTGRSVRRRHRFKLKYTRAFVTGDPRRHAPRRGVRGAPDLRPVTCPTTVQGVPARC